MPYVLAEGFDHEEVRSAFAALWPGYTFTVKTRLADLPPTGPVLALFPMNVRPSAGLDPAVARPLRDRGNSFFLYATGGDEAWDQPAAYATVPHANITYTPRQRPIFDASTYNTQNAVDAVRTWFEQQRMSGRESAGPSPRQPAPMTTGSQMPCVLAVDLDPAKVAIAFAALWPSHRFTVKTQLAELPPAGPVIALFQMNARPSAVLDPAVAGPLRNRGNVFFLYATRGDESWDQPGTYAAVPYANITYAPQRSPIFDVSTYNTQNAVATLRSWLEQQRLASQVNCTFCNVAPATVDCSGCKTQGYCNDTCAAADWPRHLSECAQQPSLALDRLLKPRSEGEHASWKWIKELLMSFDSVGGVPDAHYTSVRFQFVIPELNTRVKVLATGYSFEAKTKDSAGNTVQFRARGGDTGIWDSSYVGKDPAAKYRVAENFKAWLEPGITQPSKIKPASYWYFFTCLSVPPSQSHSIQNGRACRTDCQPNPAAVSGQRDRPAASCQPGDG